MMYKFGTSKKFDKALKLCKKRGYPIEELRKAVHPINLKRKNSQFLIGVH